MECRRWTNFHTGRIRTMVTAMGLTGGLLVKDIDRPDRFLYVLLRPQWKSWLVRGAYIITVFGGLVSLKLLDNYLQLGFDWLWIPGIVFAGLQRCTENSRVLLGNSPFSIYLT